MVSAPPMAWWPVDRGAGWFDLAAGLVECSHSAEAAYVGADVEASAPTLDHQPPLF